MNVKLKVLHGARAGKEFGIPTPECLVGRSQDCHLQPKSEAISRHHCVVYVRDGRVFVRDLKSRNGTFVNGQRVDNDCEVQNGDTLEIGPLAFEVHLDQAVAGKQRPVVASVREAAESTGNDARNVRLAEESTIADWLADADEVARLRRLNEPETRQLQLEGTDEVKPRRVIEQAAGERRDAQPQAESETPSPTKAVAGIEESDKRVRVIGKLPPRAEEASEDSSEAASHALKKFFARRW